MTGYAKLTQALLAAWFVVSLVASALHLYRTAAYQPPLPLGLAAVTPIAVFLVWFAVSPRFREFTLSLSPRLLTLAQTWRVGGFVFLALATYRILPWFFALPAGLGDMAVGATALAVALNRDSPAHRTSFIAWQLFGMADLVIAVALGTLAGIIQPHGVPTAAMTVLPLSLIPTFAVPLLFIFHIICVAQARRWPRQNQVPSPQPVSVPAA
ncbi:MAG TPA: hypothetical protein VMD25_00180 [Acidobacteriaceae bacterium]|nr:hypothetical protein [Acidobacteriaceae bacterium]